MAARKSKAISAVAALSLTKKKAKSSTSSKLEITGFETVIPDMRDRKKQIDDLEAAQNIDQTKLIKQVREERLQAEKKGTFYRSCAVLSKDDKPALLSFKDSFSRLENTEENRDALKGALGDSYALLVTEGCTVKVSSGVTAEKLQQVLGADAFQKLLSVVELEEFLTFNKGFMERRATLRPNLPSATNDALDAMVEELQYKPSLKLK